MEPTYSTPEQATREHARRMHEQGQYTAQQSLAWAAANAQHNAQLWGIPFQWTPNTGDTYGKQLQHCLNNGMQLLGGQS